MSRFHIRNLIFFALLSAVSCQATPTSDYLGSTRDLRLTASIKGNAEKYVSDRSILWVESGYLTKEEAHVLQAKIDKAIMEIEEFVGMKFSKEAYKREKIEYFIHSRGEASHTITAYQPRKYMYPVVFLSFAAERRAPYVHETVHIIAWDWNTLWMKEGLAVFLNDELDGYTAFPNFGADIDELAKANLAHKKPLTLIGQNGIPKFSNRIERRLFYIFSGSFVKYLCTHIEIGKLMEIYRAKDTNKALAEMTGKNIGLWKTDWIDSIREHVGAKGAL